MGFMEMMASFTGFWSYFLVEIFVFLFNISNEKLAKERQNFKGGNFILALLAHCWNVFGFIKPAGRL